SVAGNSVIVRYVALNKLSKGELSAVISKEAEPFIPFDIKDVNLGWQILGDKEDEGGQKKMEVILAAAKKDLVDDKVDILRSAGLNPLVIDVDSFALASIISRSESSKEAQAVIILNIGAKATSLTVAEKDVVRVARDVLIAGSNFTKAVSKALSVDAVKAEEIKKIWGIALDNTIANYNSADDKMRMPASKAMTEVAH
ncbi:MAG: pilus assembly protein PilM, partial [Elusimicrobia bacterium]|nr:pilus assembly protein PilM [Elusimicrobiota bacterium]